MIGYHRTPSGETKGKHTSYLHVIMVTEYGIIEK